MGRVFNIYFIVGDIVNRNLHTLKRWRNEEEEVMKRIYDCLKQN